MARTVIIFDFDFYAVVSIIRAKILAFPTENSVSSLFTVKIIRACTTVETGPFANDHTLIPKKLP